MFLTLQEFCEGVEMKSRSPSGWYSRVVPQKQLRKAFLIVLT